MDWLCFEFGPAYRQFCGEQDKNIQYTAVYRNWSALKDNEVSLTQLVIVLFCNCHQHCKGKFSYEHTDIQTYRQATGKWSLCVSVCYTQHSIPRFEIGTTVDHISLATILRYFCSLLFPFMKNKKGV